MVPLDNDVDDLKNLIHEKGFRREQDILAKDLVLWMVSASWIIAKRLWLTLACSSSKPLSPSDRQTLLLNASKLMARSQNLPGSWMNLPTKCWMPLCNSLPRMISISLWSYRLPVGSGCIPHFRTTFTMLFLLFTSATPHCTFDSSFTHCLYLLRCRTVPAIFVYNSSFTTTLLFCVLTLSSFRCSISASTTDSNLAQLQQFWRQLWVNQEDPFEKRDVVRDSHPVGDVDVSATFEVLRGLPQFLLSDDVLVREEYGRALEAIEGYQKTQNAVVVVGHPGIGTVFWLSW